MKTVGSVIGGGLDFFCYNNMKLISTGDINIEYKDIAFGFGYRFMFPYISIYNIHMYILNSNVDIDVQRESKNT